MGPNQNMSNSEMPATEPPITHQQQNVIDINSISVPIKKSKLKLLIVLAIAVVVIASAAFTWWYFHWVKV